MTCGRFAGKYQRADSMYEYVSFFLCGTLPSEVVMTTQCDKCEALISWGWNVDQEKGKRGFAAGERCKEELSRREGEIFVGSE